jgi:translation initiation factor IF-3
MTQENCDSLDRFNEGDEVKVAINIRGREWTSPQGEVKYFNSIQGWRIDSEVEEVTTADHSPDRDDLPF